MGKGVRVPEATKVWDMVGHRQFDMPPPPPYTPT